MKGRTLGAAQALARARLRGGRYDQGSASWVYCPECRARIEVTVLAWERARDRHRALLVALVAHLRNPEACPTQESPP